MKFQNFFSVAFSTMSSASNHEEAALIRKILTETKTIALVGASAKTERPAHAVMQYLLSKGYDVIPINPGLEGKELLGKQVYGRLGSLPMRIDMVDVFRNSDAVPGIVDEAISLGAKSIWMQIGVNHEEAASKARAAGMDVIQNRCPKIEIPNLGIAGPSSEL